MQDKPLLISQSPVSSPTAFLNKKTNYRQYVLQEPKRAASFTRQGGGAPRKYRCFLLSIPGELLIHITTYFDDPLSLLAFSLVNRRLRDLIADDNTWFRAFAFHFWRRGPESDPTDEQQLMLRRSESTWKKEFINRFNAIRRWQKSRSSTLSYQPHFWSISNMHLLNNVSLMTSNLQYGIVTRSFPLTGKILKGHLDASGTTNGFGIGNPNEEFSPNVSCIALSSCGGAGRIAWGFRNGEVATTYALRMMDSNRPATRFTRCRAEDGHTGDVRCVLFAGREDELVFSGCSHGQVKLWDARRMHCLWTGWGTNDDAVILDPCVKAEFSERANVLVAALQSGDVMVWYGIRLGDDGMGGQTMIGSVPSLRVRRPVESTPLHLNTVEALFLDAGPSPAIVKILIHDANQPYFLRIVVNTSSGQVTSTHFCDGHLSPISSLKPYLVVQEQSFGQNSAPPAGAGTILLPITPRPDIPASRDHSFILTGHSLGSVSVWDWDTKGLFAADNGLGDAPQHHQEIAQVAPSRKWEAHDDGAVCAIEVNGVVIVTGSSCGTLKIWDCLSLAPLRSFASPASKVTLTDRWDPTGHIILRDELVVASVGSRVLVWQAGVIPTDKKGKAKHTGKPKGRGTGSTMKKWQQQIELIRDIRESQRLLNDERAHARQAYDRESSQLSTLNELGLSEAEAVEYVLMLSREEEDRRRASVLVDVSAPSSSTLKQGAANESGDTEGVFVLDEYSEFGRPPPIGHELASPTLCSSPPSLLSLRNDQFRSVPGAASFSNSKVQPSPPFRPEPSEAGFSGDSSTTESDARSQVVMGAHRSQEASASTSTSSHDDPEAFPAMSSSAGTPSDSLSSPQLIGSWTKGSPSSSSGSATRLRMTADATSNTNPVPSSSTVPQSTLLVQSSSREYASRAREKQEEDELRFVIELSLAEARSREDH